MDKVTPEQVREAAQQHGISRFKLRECSICGVGLHYLIRDDGSVRFQAACGCNAGSPAELRSWDELAASFNMQSPENRAAMWADFLASGTGAPRQFLTADFVAAAEPTTRDFQQLLAEGVLALASTVGLAGDPRFQDLRRAVQQRQQALNDGRIAKADRL